MSILFNVCLKFIFERLFLKNRTYVFEKSNVRFLFFERSIFYF